MPNHYFEKLESDNPLTRLPIPAERTWDTAAKISNPVNYAIIIMIIIVIIIP
jgi:hypothetical protein